LTARHLFPGSQGIQESTLMPSMQTAHTTRIIIAKSFGTAGLNLTLQNETLLIEVGLVVIEGLWNEP
jgi:hypothetical protein